MKVGDFLNSTESVLHILVHLMDKSANEILVKYFEINFTQFRLLMILSKNPEANQKYFATCLALTEAGISKTILDLEKSELIKVSQSPKSRRENHFEITPKGQELISEAFTKIRKSSQKLFNCLSKAEQTNLHNYLSKLLKELTI